MRYLHIYLNREDRSTYPYAQGASGYTSVFFVVSLLPIILVLMTVGSDVSTIFTERVTEQKVIDAAALYGAKYLPYVDNAIAASTYYVKANSRYVSEFGSAVLSVSGSSDTVQISIKIPITLTFFKLFGLSQNYSYKLSTLARIQPKDVVLFFDSSRYLAPSISGGELWGKEHSDGADFSIFEATSDPNQSKDWKTATFYRNFSFAGIPPSELIATLRTQQCFNPAFSGIKEAVILFYDSLSLFNLNSVGILTGPSKNGSVFTVKSVDKGGFPSPWQGEGIMENKILQGPLKDEHCLAAAEIAQAELDTWRNSKSPDDLLYTLPPPRMRHAFPAFSSAADQTILGRNFMPPGATFVDPSSGKFKPTMAKHLAARDAIWARRESPTSEIDIGEVITSVGDSLINAPLRVEERGALVGLTTKTGYIFLGNMPRIKKQGGGYCTYNYPDHAGCKKEILKVMRNSFDHIYSHLSDGDSISLYIFVPRHYSMYQAEPDNLGSYCEAFYNDSAEIISKVEQWNHQWSDKLRVAFVRIPDVGSLAHEVAGYLPYSERSIFLGDLN